MKPRTNSYLACQSFIDARKLLLALKAWIRANPKEFTIICVGIILFALACATPAILGAIGFSAMGPVLGSVAVGWQASIGSVAAGSLFAFLQSVAMGGAAFRLVTGIGTLGVVIALIGIGTLEAIRNKAADISENVGETSWRLERWWRMGPCGFVRLRRLQRCGLGWRLEVIGRNGRIKKGELVVEAGANLNWSSISWK